MKGAARHLLLSCFQKGHDGIDRRGPDADAHAEGDLFLPRLEIIKNSSGAVHIDEVNPEISGS